MQARCRHGLQYSVYACVAGRECGIVARTDDSTDVTVKALSMITPRDQLRDRESGACDVTYGDSSSCVSKTRKLCYRKDDRAMRAIQIVSRGRDMAIRNYPKMAAAAILNLFESKIAPLDPPSPKTPLYNQT